MSSAVARPMRNSSKKLTSSTLGISYVSVVNLAEAAGRSTALDLLDRRRFATTQIDAELFRSAEDVLIGVPHLDLHPVAGQHLDVQAQRLHFLDQDLEGLRNARLGDVLALDDRLVDLDPAEDVVGLDGEQLLEGVSGAVRLERPYLHFAEALAAELRLPA